MFIIGDIIISHKYPVNRNYYWLFCVTVNTWYVKIITVSYFATQEFIMQLRHFSLTRIQNVMTKIYNGYATTTFNFFFFYIFQPLNRLSRWNLRPVSSNGDGIKTICHLIPSYICLYQSRDWSGSVIVSSELKSGNQCSKRNLIILKTECAKIDTFGLVLL